MVLDPATVEAVRGQLTLVLRPMYGNPVRQRVDMEIWRYIYSPPVQVRTPASVLAAILGSEERTEQWRQQLRAMVDRERL